MAKNSTSSVGPIELLYSSADAILNAVQTTINRRNVSDFIETVKWDEPFVRFLIGFQIGLFLFTYLTRRSEKVQFSVLMIITAISLFAEKLNNYGKKHWMLFATQDYFDKPGLFMVVFVSGPFLLLANFIVIGISLRAVKLYAKKKQRQIANQRRAATPGTASQASQENDEESKKRN